MGARLVAASVAIYALAIAFAFFLGPFPTIDGRLIAIYWGGAVALLAVFVLVLGIVALRSARVRRVAAAVGAIVILAFVVSSLAGYPLHYAVVWIYYYFGLFLAPIFLLAYPVLYRALWELGRPVAARALTDAAPLAIAVGLAPIVLGPRYWPDAGNYDKATALMVTTAIVALIGTVALGTGIPVLRLPLGTSARVLAVLVAIQFGLMVRGLPNPPMSLATSAPLAMEYPASRPDLAADLAPFRERLAVILRRSGVVLPPGGVYARYRWYDGPADPAAPRGTVVVTMMVASIDDDPDWRLKGFASQAAASLVPAPDWRNHDAQNPWRGYHKWLSAPDEPQPTAHTLLICNLMINTKTMPTDDEFVPYVRAELTGGLDAARALYTRLVSAPPSYGDWLNLLRSDCTAILRGS